MKRGAWLLVGTVAGLAGCATVTNYQAIDQALLARATRQASDALNVPGLQGRSVSIRVSGFERDTGARELAEGYLRARLTQAGDIVVEKEGADYLLTVLGEIQGMHVEETRLFRAWPFLTTSGTLSRERTARVKLAAYLYDLKEHKVTGPFNATGAATFDK